MIIFQLLWFRLKTLCGIIFRTTGHPLSWGLNMFEQYQHHIWKIKILVFSTRFSFSFSEVGQKRTCASVRNACKLQMSEIACLSSNSSGFELQLSRLRRPPKELCDIPPEKNCSVLADSILMFKRIIQKSALTANKYQTQAHVAERQWLAAEY